MTQFSRPRNFIIVDGDMGGTGSVEVTVPADEEWLLQGAIVAMRSDAHDTQILWQAFINGLQFATFAQSLGLGNAFIFQTQFAFGSDMGVVLNEGDVLNVTWLPSGTPAGLIATTMFGRAYGLIEF